MNYLSKKISFTFFLLLTSLLCRAQDIEPYDLPFPVADITPNADSTYLGIMFGEYRKNGKLKNDTQCGIFNVKTHKLTYVSDIHGFGKNEFYFLKDGALIATTKEDKHVTLKYVDVEENSVLWSSDNILTAYHISKPFSMIFSKYQDTFDDAYYIQLKKADNGEVLWREKSSYSKIFRRSYIIDVEESNDSSELFILSQNLFKFNIEEGVKKEYKYKNATYNRLYRSGDLLYLTENKQLTCLDMNLDTLWTRKVAPFSYHRFAEQGDTIYLINMGYVSTAAFSLTNKYVPQYIKKPYILSFNKRTGKQIDFIELDRKKYTDKIHLLYVDNYFYYKGVDSQNFQKVSTDKDKIMVALYNGDVCITDRKQEMIDKYEDKRCYYEMFKIDDTICVGRKCDDDLDIDFFLINSKGDVTYHFPDGTKEVCNIGNEIFYCIDGKLYSKKL